MLSHALGATKSTHTKCAPTGSLEVKHVASYLNEKGHDYSSSIIAKHDEMPVESCMFEFVSCVALDLWDMMNELTLSSKD